MEMKDFELTEKDFYLLIAGLDALPHSDMAAEMMKDALTAMMEDRGKRDSHSHSAALYTLKKRQESDKKRKEEEKQQLIEDVKILQGKLLMFKRYLIQIDALKQADELINPAKK